MTAGNCQPFLYEFDSFLLARIARPRVQQIASDHFLAGTHILLREAHRIRVIWALHLAWKVLMQDESKAIILLPIIPSGFHKG